ncbi:MAG TPA: PilZ domain-containing protein [Myxococcota bacterium]|nr:PilZ domain-containing protein [Myxococcota bacterium]
MTRASRRQKRRMFCEIVHEGRAQRAIVLDVSRSGLFVQTSARFAPGTEIELLLRLDANAEPIRLRTAVARQKAVPAQLTQVAHGGVGLRILEAPREYYHAIGEAPPWPSARGRPAREAAATTPTAQPKPRFRVRVKQREGPRSRILDIAAETPERACALALVAVGPGWEALGADRA